MYLEYYKLAGMPFQLTPDSRFFFDSEQHRKALAFLNYGVAQGEGFVVVTGEVGAGKTTLVEHLLETLDPAQYVAGRIVTTQLGSNDMLYVIASALGLFREGLDKASTLARMTQFFADMQARQKRVLLIVDEAQSLSAEAVEELRMLSNIVVGRQAPFQGILLGQPEFRAVLSAGGLEQFRQRVTAFYHLGALNEIDTRKYIEHRLHHVGWSNDPSFTDGAFAQIYAQTSGIPRRINTLCARLMLLGFLEEKHEITSAMTAAVAEEMANELGAPLGSAAALRPSSSLQNTGRPLRRYSEDDNLNGRIARLEAQFERHDRAINRAFDIALRYLPSIGEN